MSEKVFTGKTTEDAVEKALKDLGVSKDQVEITVLEEGKKGGLFGIGAKDAKVQVTLKEEEKAEVKTQTLVQEEEYPEEITDANLIKTKEFLEGLFSFMGIEVQIKIKETEENVKIKLISDKSASLIGYRGEVLDSLQTLAGAVANKGREVYKRVVVDCEGYRNRREDTLKALAEKLADKAVAKGRKIRLEPMNPFERRVIHSALSERTDVKTESEGKDPVRYIVIIPENLSKFDRRDRNSHSRYGDRNRNNRSGGGKSSYGSPRPKRTGFGATFLGNSKDNQEND